MTMKNTLDSLYATREQARTHKRAFSSLATLLTQIIDCLENDSITEEQANDYKINAVKLHASIMTATPQELTAITERAYKEHARLWKLWLAKEDHELQQAAKAREEARRDAYAYFASPDFDKMDL